LISSNQLKVPPTTSTSLPKPLGTVEETKANSHAHITTRLAPSVQLITYL
jgi:hypothetical protein